MDSDEFQVDLTELPPLLHGFAAQTMGLAATVATVEGLFQDGLPHLAAALGGEYAAVVQGGRGRWSLRGSTGAHRTLPTDLMAESLDSESAQWRRPWIAAPLDPRSPLNEVLVARQPGETVLVEDFTTAARLLGVAATMVRRRQQDQRRMERLEAILEIAGTWIQTLEMDSLLESVAEASTRLLQAERASIFLWDRPNKTLVARPALGVEGGELRIADDTGVVGQVVRSGHALRINEDDDQSPINRHVDQQLGYRTQSLLCVPLRGQGGELFGAFELINKRDGNFTAEDEAALHELAGHAALALENTRQHEQLIKSRNQMADQAAEGAQLIGDCAAIEALRSTIRRVADTDLAVLLLGENGTGKEVVAQRVHYMSRRRNEPFVAVNCAALTETLLESELFGHERGAFTDARETRIGKFESASGGTLFLDEIGDMSLGGQAKLLRVLEEKVVTRVGGSTPIHTDARVIAATNQNLAEMVRSKRFREDLYYRLNVVTLDLPALRDRGEDIFLLAEHFLGDFCLQARRRPPELTSAARKRLLTHAWPGNVRELRNLMERIAYLSSDDRIDVDELAFILSPRGDESAVFAGDLPLAEATRRFQCEYIGKQVSRSRGNMTAAADRLGLHRSNLYRKMRQLGMTSAEDPQE